MKHLKTKLVSAIAMLAVAAIMMTSATYAWFTISTNPEVKGVSANVTANGNLEIALDSGSDTEPAASTTGDYGKNETWGNMVDVSSLFNGANLTLKPVQATLDSTSKSFTFKYPQYGNDGRISSLASLNRLSVADATTTNYKDLGGVYVYSDVSTLTGINSTSINANSASIYAFEIDYWLRSNTATKVSLLSSGVARDGANMTTGGGSTLDIDGVTILMVVSSANTQTYYELVKDSNNNLSMNKITMNPGSSTWTKATGSDVDKYSLAANTAAEFKVFVFMNGETLTNADAKQALTAFTMNIQFTTDEALEAMKVNPVSGS